MTEVCLRLSFPFIMHRVDVSWSLQDVSVLRAPLRPMQKFELTGWSDRAIAALPPPSPPDDDAIFRPCIRGNDVKEAANILIFQVQWLFNHAPGGVITRQLRTAFQADLRRQFPGSGVVCHLVPLSELLRHARHLDVEV